MKLHEENILIIPLLTKNYMDLDIIPVFPHLVKEVHDFKAFINLKLLMAMTALWDTPNFSNFGFICVIMVCGNNC
jgi:hypothetical protein